MSSILLANEIVSSRSKTSLIQNVILAGIVVAVVILVFGQQLLQLQYGLPSNFPESGLYLWHTWWPTFSVGLPESPTISAYASAPYLQNHLLYAPLLQSVVFRIANGLLGQPILVFNLGLIIAVSLTFLLTFILARQININITLALGVALTVCTTVWYIDAVRAGDLILASSFTLPLALWLFERWRIKQTFVRAILVSMALAVMLLLGMQYLAGLVIVIIPYIVWVYLTDIRSKGQAMSDADLLQIGAVIFIVGLVLLVHPMPNIVRSTLAFEPVFSNPDVFPLIDVSIPVALAQTIALPVTLALIAALVNRDWNTHSIFLTLGLLSLVIGLRLLPDPLLILATLAGVEYLPLYAPDVLFGPATLMLTLYAFLVWNDNIEYRETPWAIVGVTSLAVVSTALTFIFNQPVQTSQPIQPIEIAFLRQMQSQPEDYIVLHYPTDQASIYGVYHQKRLINGSLPYSEPELVAAYSSFAFLNIQTDEHLSDEDIVQFTDAVSTWRIGYIILHQDLLEGPEVETISDSIRQTDQFCPPKEVGSLIIYKATWHPDGC